MVGLGLSCLSSCQLAEDLDDYEPLNALDANKANPLEAKLTGPVEVRISHPSSDEISAKLTNLTLQRSSADSDDWHLPAQEVKRAKKGTR